LPRLSLIGLFLIAGLLLSIPVIRGASKTFSFVLAEQYPPPGEMIDAGGHRLHLNCTGKGSPVVLIEPGLGTDWISWQVVRQKVSQFTCVCVYDRAGYGWSDSGPFPRTSGQIAAELELLLKNSGIAGPYVLAAHSFGAYGARIYAARNSAQVAGLVLVDPSHEDEARLSPPPQEPAPVERPFGLRDLLQLVPPLGTDHIIRLWKGRAILPPELSDVPPDVQNRFVMGTPLSQRNAEISEMASLSESEAQAARARLPLNMPLRVLTSMKLESPRTHKEPVPDVSRVHIEVQARLAASSTNGKQIRAHASGHFIQLDEPELVVHAIQDVVGQPRRNRTN